MAQLQLDSLRAQCLVHTDAHVRIHVDHKTVDVCADLSVAIGSAATTTVHLRCRPNLSLRSIVLLDEHTGSGTPCAFTLEEANIWDTVKARDPGAFEEAAGREADAWERGNLVVTIPA